MRLDDVVSALDAYFRVADVRGDDWLPIFESVYGDAYWREYVELGYEGRWNGLMVRGAGEVARVVTCVFPSDRIVASLEPGTLLFSEHPLDFADVPGFLPLARESFSTLRERVCGFYHVHAPLDMHPKVSPSRLCAQGFGLDELAEFFPIAEGIPGGAGVIGESCVTLDDLAEELRGFLSSEIPASVLTRPRGQAAGRVAVVDATHYGTEKPPQLAMVGWFERLGLPAEFRPDGPK